MKLLIWLSVSLIFFCASHSFRGGWIGDPQIISGLLLQGGVFFINICLLGYCLFCAIQKRNVVQRKNLVKRCVIGLMLMIGGILTCSGVLMKISSQMGRYFYWRTHREMLEIIAQDILNNQINGFHIVPPIRTTQLGYPVFSYIDPTNGVNLVVFSHWLTPPKRRGGFVYVQQENDELSWLLTVKLEQHKKIGDKWYEYKGWVSDSYTEW